MRNIHKSTPSSFRRRENAAAIVKAPPPGALTKGPDRKFPGLHPPLGGATSPSLCTNRRFAFPILAFLAVLAVGLLFLLPGGLLQAQDNGDIMYAENGTAPVATYTAVDPEGTAITSWTLAGTDAGVFDINDGVLTFKKSPDYEDAKDVVGISPSTAAASDNTYEVMVKAMDSTGKTGMEEVKVEVTNVDEAGTVTLSAVQPQSTVSFNATLEDLDGATSNPKWQWAKAGSRNGSYGNITGATSSMYIPKDADIGSWLRATVTYTDPEDSGKTAMMKSMYSVQRIRGDNNAPEFAADQDPVMTGPQPDASREVPENSPAGTFIGNPVTATDDDGDKLTYTLTGTNADNFDIDFATGQIMANADLDNSEEGQDGTVLTVIVRATDPAGIPQADPAVPANSDIVTVNITVTDVNEPPEVTGTTSPDTNDGAELMFNEVDGNIDTALDTYMGDNPEDSVDSTWSVAGPDGGKFTAEDGALKFKAKPDYEMPTDANMDNVYEVTVQAADADGNTGMKMVKVTVENANESGKVTLDKVQPRVGIAVKASLEDPDGSISSLTWAWTDSSDNALGGTDTNSDTYTPVAADIDDTLKATAMYTDGEGSGNTATGNSTNMVAEDTRNLPPKFEDQDTEMDGVQNTMTTREVEENTKALAGTADDDAEAADASADNVGSAVNAADPDPNADPLTYTLGGADAAMFRVRQDNTTTASENEGGQIEVAAGTMLDYEMKQTYMVTVMAEDSFGATASIEVTIMVKDLDEVPEIMVGGKDSVMYAENGTRPVATYTAVDPEGTAITSWTLAGTDAGVFDINDGVLTFKKSPDYEDAKDVVGISPSTAAASDNTYEVMVKAMDSTGKTGMEEVKVEVTNVDEAGTVTLSAVQPQSTVSFNATLEDLDGATSNPKWQWAKAGSRNGSYGNITGATSSMYIPKDADIGSWLRATVTYTDPEDSGKTAMMKSMYSVQRIRGDNNAPEFAADQDPVMTGPQPDASREVPENSPAGTFIGNPVTATDDDGDKLTYTLTGTNADNFDIDFATGQIMANADLDNSEEGQDGTVLTVIVRATDPAGIPQADPAVPANSDIVTVNITVTDVNEPPEVTGTTSPDTNDGAELMFNEVDGNIDTALDTYMGDNPEDSVDSTWSVAGPDGGKFTAEDGALKFKAKPDYEMPTDANMDNVYEVTVQAADADGNTGMKMVKVTVENANEPGKVTLDKVQPRLGIAVKASLEDPDGSISGLTWAWTDGSDNALGGTDTNSDTYTPVAADIDDTLKATAMYTDGEGSGKTATGNSTNMVAEDTRNLPPKFEDQDTEMDGVQNTMTTREVEENTKALAGTADDDAEAADASADNVGSAVNAADPDPNADPLTYTLGGADAAMFRVRQDNTTTASENEGGQIEVAAGTMLDYEMKQTYMVTVMAEDSFGATASIEVTIMVKDLDEVPEIMVGGLAISGSTRVPLAEDGMTTVGSYTASGPDAASARWSLEGDDRADFRIEGSGMSIMLIFRSSPNYEAPTDANRDNRYMVTIKATDGTYTDTRDVMVMVTDVDEATPMDLLTRYDANNSGVIDLDEVFRGIDDYFDHDDRLTLEEVYELVDLYFES